MYFDWFGRREIDLIKKWRFFMKLASEAELLRIFIGEADKYEGKPLYEVIINLARQKGMAGATVIRGLMGFGAHSRMHTAKILRISEDLPIIIEIVDEPEKIEALLPEIDKMIREGLVTLEKIRVIAYRSDSAGN
jgi:PII-like signaling protein